MMKSVPFEVTVSGTHAISLPIAVIKPFLDANKKRVKVQASHKDKIINFHAALQKRKDQYFLIFGKKNQKALGVFPNDYFELQFFEDTSKYGVDIPEELEAVFLSDYEASQIFEAFTDGKKRGIIYMIAGYKGSQTRIDKSLLVCENLKRGVRDHRLLLKSI